MNKTVIKELQKLMALCMEINSKTKHDISFHENGLFKEPTFSVSVFEGGFLEASGERTELASNDKITLPNINKCRQKALKYKEW